MVAKVTWSDKSVMRSQRKMIRYLEKQVAAMDARLQDLMEKDETYSTFTRLLQTIPGIGLKSSQLLLSEMSPVWQYDSSRAWVAFAGVCPQPIQSGQSSYSRLSRMGFRRVRTELYMSEVSAMRSNPAIADLVARLKARGKTGRVAVMAAMNKLIRICYDVHQNTQTV